MTATILMFLPCSRAPAHAPWLHVKMMFGLVVIRPVLSLYRACLCTQLSFLALMTCSPGRFTVSVIVLMNGPLLPISLMLLPLVGQQENVLTPDMTLGHMSVRL